MSDKQLFIPEKIKVGFQERKDTYTKKLAYVIYYDNKGVLRKEKSWQSWRNENINPVEFENIPTSGFVLNKGVGGQRQSYGWNARNEYIRVYDSRDFEFEISVANLLFILRECDCSKGKGLEGKFVYAWDGTELVLLPEVSSDYQNSKKFTQLQSCKVASKDLIPGASYETKKQEVLIYLGRLTKHCVHRTSYKEKTGKKQVFWDGKNFVFLDSLKDIAILHSDVIALDYAELIDKYNKSIHGSRPVKLFTKKSNKEIGPSFGNWTTEESDGVYLQCSSSYEHHYNNGRYIYDSESYKFKKEYRIYIKDGILFSDYIKDEFGFKSKELEEKEKRDYQRRFYNYSNYEIKYCNYIEPTGLKLWVELESGSKFQIENNYLVTPKQKEDNNGEESDY